MWFSPQDLLAILPDRRPETSSESAKEISSRSCSTEEVAFGRQLRPHAAARRREPGPRWGASGGLAVGRPGHRCTSSGRDIGRSGDGQLGRVAKERCEVSKQNGLLK